MSKYINTTRQSVFKNTGASGSGSSVGGLFSQTGDSSNNNTILETTLIDGGVGSLTVPANSFAVGDSFSLVMGGKISCANNSPLTIRIKSGSIILATTGAITLPLITNKNWELEVSFTIRQIGAAGVASIVTHGDFLYLRNSSSSFEGFTFSTINNTTFNTTISNTLDITGQWSTLDPTNVLYSEIFTLSKIY
jgi:hypothetical protein